MKELDDLAIEARSLSRRRKEGTISIKEYDIKIYEIGLACIKILDSPKPEKPLHEMEVPARGAYVRP